MTNKKSSVKKTLKTVKNSINGCLKFGWLITPFWNQLINNQQFGELIGLIGLTKGLPLALTVIAIIILLKLIGRWVDK